MDRLYPESDVLGIELDLPDAERALLWKLRSFLDENVRPLLADYWDRGVCPAHLRPGLAALGLTEASDEPRTRALYEGFRTFELARTDLSMTILYGGQVGMFHTIVTEGGSPEQVEEWEADISSFARTGCFALTEPEHGSDVAGGLETTATQAADGWSITGHKRWIGNATLSDHLAVVARVDDGVGVFLIPSHAPGVTMSVIGRKIAVRMVENADIVLDQVRVADDARLARIRSFADINRAFLRLRPDVAWTAAGMQAGAFEAARAYALRRRQFGRPIGGFQLIQEKLARILGNLTASLAFAARLSRLVADRDPRAEPASLGKSWIATRLRESVALAREICGGEGVTIDSDVARFFADAEALYTFEGTHEMNSLIVGRGITGLSAFTR